jgi:hypothetical protein
MALTIYFICTLITLGVHNPSRVDGTTIMNYLYMSEQISEEINKSWNDKPSNANKFNINNPIRPHK